jgi:hypothetical protein
MAQTYFPFDSGSGANVTEAQWSLMAKNWLNTGAIKGVLNELSVYADSTGMQVKVKSGQAWMQGHFFQSDTEETLAISNADVTNSRIDRVIVRLDWTANTIQLAVLSGIPAASPSAPSLTQNSSRWEISLAQIYVGVNVSTIVVDNVTDERIYAIRPQDFVLVTNGKTISGTDLNMLDGNGFYKGNSLINSPDSSSTAYWLILNQKYDKNGQTQTAIEILSTIKIYQRIKNQGTWGPWQQIPILTAEGILNIPTQPFVYVWNTTNQSIPAGVQTKITSMNGEGFDRQNEWDGSRYTATQSGIYSVKIYLDWGTSSPSGDIWVRLYRNGSYFSILGYANGQRAFIGNLMISLNAGDYLEFYVDQYNSGNAAFSISSAIAQIAKIY